MQITVAKLKELLVDMANLPTERQRVIYKGRVLENDQQLSSHGGKLDYQFVAIATLC